MLVMNRQRRRQQNQPQDEDVEYQRRRRRRQLHIQQLERRVEISNNDMVICDDDNDDQIKATNNKTNQFSETGC